MQHLTIFNYIKINPQISLCKLKIPKHQNSNLNINIQVHSQVQILAVSKKPAARGPPWVRPDPTCFKARPKPKRVKPGPSLFKKGRAVGLILGPARRTGPFHGLLGQPKKPAQGPPKSSPRGPPKKLVKRPA